MHWHKVGLQSAAGVASARHRAHGAPGLHETPSKLSNVLLISCARRFRLCRGLEREPGTLAAGGPGHRSGGSNSPRGAHRQDGVPLRGVELVRRVARLGWVHNERHADLARQVGAQRDGGQLVQLLLDAGREVDALEVAAPPAHVATAAATLARHAHQHAPAAAAPAAGRARRACGPRPPAALAEEALGDGVHGHEVHVAAVLGAHLHQHLFEREEALALGPDVGLVHLVRHQHQTVLRHAPGCASPHRTCPLAYARSQRGGAGA